ncbi:unnamed protein product, partial [Mesorhabditis belari]|uniref:Uncharacterized protein n=1 Tax=Mesorhabditis belari TaxID=2138241 RepID=A0AAF3EV02_9BILA
MERDYFAHLLPDNQEISFSFKPSAGVNVLQLLITSCCWKDYTKRIDAQTALEMAKEVLKECHNHEVAPFYKKDQPYLIEPIGIDGSTKQIPVNFEEKLKKKLFNVDSISQADNTFFIVPDVSSFTKLNSKQQVVDEKPRAPAAELISKGNQNVLKAILAKVQSETYFHPSIMNDYLSWRIYSDRYWFTTEKITDSLLKIWIPDFIIDFERVYYNDVNEIRKTLCESFKNEFNLLNDQEKKEFAEHVQASYLQDQKFTPFSLDDTSYSLNICQKFASLINFDSTIQSFAFQQAFYVLIECQTDLLATFDLLKLIKIAIENIEQLEKIFAKRFYFSTYYLIGSRNEWCLSDIMDVSGERLYFKNNLTDFRRTREGREGPVDIETKEKSPIDIEALRRALYEQKNVLERYVIAKKKHFPWHLDQRVRDLCKEDVEPGREVYKQFRLKISLTKDLPFPDYFFAFHFWPGLINDQTGEIFKKIGGFPSDLDSDFQVPYAQHHNERQKEFIEMYTRYMKMFFLLNRWKKQDIAPEIIYLLEDLVNDTNDGFKDFKFVCLYLANEEYEGLFLERLQHETIIFTREFQMHKTDLIGKDHLRILGFVEIKFFDLIDVAKEMIESFRLLYRAKISSNRESPEKQLKYLEDCVKKFWNKQRLVLHNSRNDYGKLPLEKCQVKSLEKIARNGKSTDEIEILPLLKNVADVISNVFGGSKTSSDSKATNFTENRDLDLD